MVKVNQKDISKYFKEKVYSTYNEFARKFNITTVWARKILCGNVVSSLNKNGKYVLYTSNKKFDSNGLIETKGIIFSKYGNTKNTLVKLVKANENISSTKIKEIMGLDVSSQITKLIKEKKIFCKKRGRIYFYSIKAQNEKIIQKEDFDISSLKEDDKVLKHLQIIKELKENKKTEVAKKHNVSTETVSNIEKRFNDSGVKGLIHTRKSKATKVSSSDEGAIIIESIKHPEKIPEELQESINKPVTLNKVKEVLKKIKDIKSQKKILLELQ